MMSLVANPTFHLGIWEHALQKGSILYGQVSASLKYNRGLYAPYRPRFDSSITVRLFKGPHFHLFAEESQRQFYKILFNLSAAIVWATTSKDLPYNFRR